jgi:small nuclear ribonucleoprotein (snRNP)-like protein
VVPAEQVFRIRTLSADNPEVKAIIYYSKNNNRNRISNLPFTFSFPELDIDRTENVQSNSSGETICSIAEMAPKGNQRKIMTALNTEIYFGKETAGNILQKMFSLQGSVPYGYLTVNVEDLKAYFESVETEFGRPAMGQPVTNLFKKELSENFFSFVSDRDDADVIVKVTANTVEGKIIERYDNLHNAYLDCNITISNARTNKEVYSTGLQNIRGTKTGSFSLAAQDAREKAKKQIQQKIIPELRQIKF